jgi:DNA polymerase-1
MKYDAKVLARYGIDVAPIDDTMLMSYAMNAGLHGHGMDALAERYLAHPIPIKELIGSGKSQITFDRWRSTRPRPTPPRMPISRCGSGTCSSRSCTGAGDDRLRDAGTPAGAGAGADGAAGIKVDRDTLSRMSNAFAQKMAGLEAEIHELAGETFNVGSPQAAGRDPVRQDGPGGRQEGQDREVFHRRRCARGPRDGPRPAARVLDWRQLSKLKSTYTDALQDHINAETGRVHTSYVIAGANTGRLASTDPNLQNIPVRTEEGRRIREAFVAEEGKVLVSLDYSQIELRILAHIADIDALKQAFREGQDIHAMTASEMFNVPLDEMTRMVRRQAKAINFGVIYGISGFGLAQPAHPAGRGAGLHRPLFRALPRHQGLHGRTVAFARQTAMSRRCSAARSTRPRSTPRARARASPPRRDQRADPGHGGGRHPPRHDPHGGRDRPGPAGQDAPAGP